ncbi:MAG: LytR C-terminal domain-containing protein [Acidimicrobiales bacterium]|nr:LytR C-terminal domain-containing protein [Acidimicrobiales bacterium]MCB9393283.1 LytR C-terminal domain-containing protein [Acidimicrobiaceae bacterium]
MDKMLRDLLDVDSWDLDSRRAQRGALLTHIDRVGDASERYEPDPLLGRPIVLEHQARPTLRAWTSRRVVAGVAAAALIGVGTLATLRFSGHRSSEPGAANDVPAPSSATAPPTTGVGAASSEWPDLLPSITPSNGEVVEASIAQTAVENPRYTPAVVGLVEGSSVRDLVTIAAVETEPYLAEIERALGVTDATKVNGLDVDFYELREKNAFGPSMAIFDYDNTHSVVVYGSDPLGFLSLAGTSFASISDAGSSPTSPLALEVGRLPEGYETLALPQPMVPGAVIPSINVTRANGDVLAFITLWSGPDAFGIALSAATDLTRTDDGSYWFSDRRLGSQLIRQVGVGEWLVMSNIFGANDDTPATLEEALAIADRIELVDRNTWLARYPDAIDGGTPATTLAPEDLEAAPAATEEVPVVDNTPPARVLVANASTIAGVAGRLTEQLRGDFQTLPAVNSDEPNPRERSTVYYANGFDGDAMAIAERIGGADVLPMPEELPIEGGNDALIAPDIVDGRGAIDILVMIANDHAETIDEAITP